LTALATELTPSPAGQLGHALARSLEAPHVSR
jgi:hypothetical protein